MTMTADTPGTTLKDGRVVAIAGPVVDVEFPPDALPEINFALEMEAQLEGDTIKQARFALGGVAHKPWRDAAAEATLRGQAAGAETFKRAADALLRDAKGLEHNSFKIDLARRAIVRALTQAARGTPQSQSNKKII